MSEESSITDLENSRSGKNSSSTGLGLYTPPFEPGSSMLYNYRDVFGKAFRVDLHVKASTGKPTGLANIGFSFHMQR
jgi:hypothetical protein